MILHNQSHVNTYVVKKHKRPNYDIAFNPFTI